ncbi:DUF6463 family protein [Marinomonas sp. 15G1-11]|uniref:DUF6463 family protein n=1 Tax=Marinomonas phaeophyticola TaxID=3004091 RepID=A0ABT4JWG7_9GAMM|nr:DUF6463 family protein [Marinomonas sp. 15G1-11]MCZ2722705.1 DUF6463 family protein [Marinomonas sp. 15G1-11]
MKNWVGKWLMFVSFGHTIVGLMLFDQVYKAMYLEGVLNSVIDERTAAASWFLLFGFLLFMFALLVDVIEREKAMYLPKKVGVLLFTLTSIGVVLMPLSGFWLVYPAAFFIIFNKRSSNVRAMWKVKSIKVPTDDYLARHRAQGAFRDALIAPLTKGKMTPYEIYLQIFSYLPSWVNGLMSMRNVLVKKLGFDVATEIYDQKKSTDIQIGDKVGFMNIILLTDHEIVGMSEDKHMQLYMSTNVQDGYVTLSTMVNLKTRIGRIYMFIITPFHWVIARTVMRQAVIQKRI